MRGGRARVTAGEAVECVSLAVRINGRLQVRNESEW